MTTKQPSKALSAPKGYLTTKEAAKIMCITESSLRNMRSENKAPKAIKVGAKVYYDPVSVNEYTVKRDNTPWKSIERIVLNWKAPQHNGAQQ